MAEAGGSEGAPAPAPRVLRITSGCATRESFVAYFRAFCEDESIFIATKTPKPEGDRVRVSIALTTGVPLIVGAGVIGESYATGENPFQRPGMRIHFDDLTPESRALFREMGAARDEQATVKAPNLAAMMAAAATPPAPRPTPPKVPTIKVPAVVPPVVPAMSRPKSDTDLSIPGADAASAMVAEAEAETRTPGSSFILPANPLSELDPDQLFAFVECTILEEEEDQPAGGLEADGTAPRASRDTEPAELVGEPEEEPRTAVAAPPVHRPAAPPPARKRLLVIGAIAGAVPALLAGVLIGRSMRPEAQEPPAVAASPIPDPIPSPIPTEAGGTATADAGTRTSTSTSTSSSSSTSTSTSDECKLRVTSEPDQASISEADHTLGTTPLDTTLPCGPHTLTARRVRYGDETRTVELTAGKKRTIELKLQRPEYTLRVDATPRAMVTIDGKSAGLSPVSVKLPGHTPVAVAVSLTGYEPWTKQVKLTKNTRLDAKLSLIKLAPVPKPKPRPAPTGTRPKPGP